MKLRIIFAFFLLVALLYAGKTRYVPLSCIARFTVVDWGPCTQSGQLWDCPKAHLQFTEGCGSAKPPGHQEQQMNITHPTVILKDDK